MTPPTPRNRYLTLALFLGGVIFAGFAVQRALNLQLTQDLDQPAFTQPGDPAALLRQSFNEAAAEPRLLLLLTANSLSSEQDVEALRKFLRDHRDTPLRLLAVWRGPVPLRAHTTRFDDDRVRHIWDPTSQLLPHSLEGAILLYPPTTTWTTSPPTPTHQLEPARAHLPQLDRFVKAGR